MPTAVKHQRELGDDIQVIFVECQGADRDTYEAFAWKMKWMGNAAMWTEERPLPTLGSGLPETALIGVDGTVILQGSPGALGKRLNEALDAEIKKSKQAPEGTPAELKKAWTHFLKGEVAAALAECDKLATPAANEAKEQFNSRMKAKVERLKRLIDEGRRPQQEPQGRDGACEPARRADGAPGGACARQRARSFEGDRRRAGQGGARQALRTRQREEDRGAG